MKQLDRRSRRWAMSLNCSLAVALRCRQAGFLAGSLDGPYV